MMLSPRSYLFTRSTTPTTESKYERPSNERRTRPSAKREKGEAMNTALSRPITPSSPVVIPTRDQRTPQGRREQRNGRPYSDRSERSQRRSRTIHSPDAVPPSVAALLALTSIPPQKTHSARYSTGAGQRLTVDAIIKHTGDAEKEFVTSLGRKPGLDFLLGSPDDDEEAASDNGQVSVMSTRTLSSESVPSLDNESLSERSPSFSSIVTPSSRGRRSLPTRRIQSISLPSGATAEDHPLSSSELDVDEMDFRVFQKSQERKETGEVSNGDQDPERPRLKSAFQSNLTASLRALRSAAKSISSLTATSIPPDDFLTRSIISIDPKVPYTDERRPPLLLDTPTPALRRYLNPTTNAPIEAHVPSSLTQTSPTQCTASIQMQTYKVSRSKNGTSPFVISRRTQSSAEEVIAEVVGPVARQRDMRENSDFIRIAVMEMAMRKKGKLDDQKPGRARWALPPRIPPKGNYEVTEEGVPVRWVGITY